jgi:hypothetical protein
MGVLREKFNQSSISDCFLGGRPPWLDLTRLCFQYSNF